MGSFKEAIFSFFKNRSLEEYIGATFAIFVGGSSLYSAKISKRVEEGIKRLNDIQYYNKNRKKIANELKECIICLEDKDVEIDLTNISKMQSCIQKIIQYDKIFNKKERKKLERILNLFELDEYTNTERKMLLGDFHYFIARLEKGDENI